MYGQNGGGGRQGLPGREPDEISCPNSARKRRGQNLWKAVLRRKKHLELNTNTEVYGVSSLQSIHRSCTKMSVFRSLRWSRRDCEIAIALFDAMVRTVNCANI